MILSPNQAAALVELRSTDRPHLPINQLTARVLERKGLVEFVQPRGNVRLTNKGRGRKL